MEEEKVAKSGHQPIQDEFTALAILRQRKCQLRKKKAGLCATCGQVAVTGTRCETHCIQHALREAQSRSDSGKVKPGRGRWLVFAGVRPPPREARPPRDKAKDKPRVKSWGLKRISDSTS